MNRFKANNPDYIPQYFKEVCKIDISSKDQFVGQFLEIDNLENTFANQNPGFAFFDGSNCDPDLMKAAYVCGNLDYLNNCVSNGDFFNSYRDDIDNIQKQTGIMGPSPRVNPAPTPSPQPNDNSDCSNCPCPKPDCQPCPSCQPCTRDVCNNLFKSSDGKKCDEQQKLSTKKELLFSLIGSLLFLLLSLPIMYRGTNVIFSSISLPTYNQSGPTMTGLILHFVVYFGLIFGIMKLLQRLKNS